MEQSTKLFLAMAFLFIVFATMKGHLQAYLALLWGNSAGKIVHTASPAGQVLSNAGITLPNFSPFNPGY